MTRNRKLLIGGLALAALGAAAAGAVARHGGHGWSQHDGWRHHGGWHGKRGLRGMHFGGMRMFCRRNSAEKIDHILVHIKHKVDPTEAQMPAFTELEAAVRDAGAKMRAACPPKRDRGARGEDDAAAPRQRPSPIERLDRMQSGLEAALEGVKTIRPAAEKLYATLSDEQKAKFTERRGKKRWSRGKWRKREGGRETQEAPPAPAQEDDNDNDAETVPQE